MTVNEFSLYFDDILIRNFVLKIMIVQNVKSLLIHMYYVHMLTWLSVGNIFETGLYLIEQTNSIFHVWKDYSNTTDNRFESYVIFGHYVFTGLVVLSVASLVVLEIPFFENGNKSRQVESVTWLLTRSRTNSIYVRRAKLQTLLILHRDQTKDYTKATVDFKGRKSLKRLVRTIARTHVQKYNTLYLHMYVHLYILCRNMYI